MDSESGPEIDLGSHSMLTIGATRFWLSKLNGLGYKLFWPGNALETVKLCFSVLDLVLGYCKGCI